MLTSPDNNFSLEYSAEAGGSILSFRHRGRDIFRAHDPATPLTPLNAASFPLTPYSNRIIGGRLDFGGVVHDIGPRAPGDKHQLHGDGWLLPWHVTEEGAAHVTLELRTPQATHTPYAYHARQTYRLDNRGLEIAMSITNEAAIALPYGLGHHPYFPRNARTVLTAHLPIVWHSERIVPVGPSQVHAKWDFSRGLALSDENFGPPAQGTEGRDLLDHCFAGWDGAARIDWPDRQLRCGITADDVFSCFVIYIPASAPYFCAEPVSHVIDAFNLRTRGVENTGTQVLQPGESMAGKMRFDVREGTFS